MSCTFDAHAGAFQSLAKYIVVQHSKTTTILLHGTRRNDGGFALHGDQTAAALHCCPKKPV
jgi:hypothetical protein